MTCGAVNGGLTCDREPGHSGEHRGYNDQIDEPMFWGSSPTDVDRLEKAAFDNGAELTLVALRDERDALSARCTALEAAVQVRDDVIREHGAFGGLFQPEGRYHERADLRLGGSAVVEGGKWLGKQLDAAEARCTALEQERDTLTARCEALEAERDEKAESANDYYRQCIGLREQLAAEKSRCEALAAERDEKARSLDELATLVGAALVYATLDSEGGEKPLVEPDHAITETVWKLVQERGKAESLCQHLEQAIREITKACDAGMRLSLPSSDIVGRIRAALASLLPTQEEAK